jgi:outer membrane protein assembly factor BamB
MWGDSPARNNVAVGENIPAEWQIGDFDAKTGAWLPEDSRNIRWVVPIGSQTYATPAIADGRIFIGSNNGHGYVRRYPSNIDLACMLCFAESDGKFLWQYSSAKLASGRVNDWPLQGIPSTPCVQGDRMWFVDNRGRVVCLDPSGFYDGEDDGPVKGVSDLLFECEMDMTIPLQRNRLPMMVRSALENLGIDLRSTSVRNGPNGSWEILRRRGRKLSLEYRVVAGDKYVDVFAVRGNNENDTQPLCRVDRFPFASLADGKIGPLLGQLLFHKGLRVSGRNELTKTDLEQTWTFHAPYEGALTSCRLTIRNERLKVFVAISGIRHEADVVWQFDMMEELGVFQHNMSNCSPAVWGEVLFVCTSNGVDATHFNVPSPRSPSFIALNKVTGELLWTDSSPMDNILHGQWASPAVGVLGGVPQVIFPGGDGWVYSFRADKWDDAERSPILLWMFDANLKKSVWRLGGRGGRNNIIAFPVIYDQSVYIAVGQDPEHGEGAGRLWCLDPTLRGDVSSELVMTMEDNQLVPLALASSQIRDGIVGDHVVENPNSAVKWKYDQLGKAFHEKFHRTLSSPAIHNNLLIIPDLSGIVHCLDATSGKVHWTCDLLASCWGSAVIADGRVYVGDEDGDVAIFPLSKDPDRAIDRDRTFANFGEPKINMLLESSIYSTPVVANNVLYISDRRHLYAISHNRRAAD